MTLISNSKYMLTFTISVKFFKIWILQVFSLFRWSLLMKLCSSMYKQNIRYWSKHNPKRNWKVNLFTVNILLFGPSLILHPYIFVNENGRAYYKFWALIQYTSVFSTTNEIIKISTMAGFNNAWFHDLVPQARMAGHRT